MNLSICILAGGEGKRMNSTLPKVCHLFKNIPMIIHVVNQALELNPNKIIIVTGKHNELIQSTIKKYINIDIFHKFSFVIQETPMGTGHAILCTLGEYLENDKVLILNGDTPKITSLLLKDFIDKGCNNLLISEIDDPFGYGRIIMNDKNEIQKIVEEKDASEEEKTINKINSGIYLIESKNLLEYIPLIKNNNKQKEYYLTDIIELMLNDHKEISGYLINKRDNNLILGVNTIDQLNNLEEI